MLTAFSVQKIPALQKAMIVAGLALVLFGVKILFIQHFGSAVPYWDQWDAEADLLYKNYLNSSLTRSILLGPHNEHRILVSRLLSLGLFELNGGWDPVLQMMVNAALHVGAIVLLVLTIQRILPRQQHLPLVLFATIVFVLPLGWENLLAGFQSQFYLLLLLSILALTGFAVASAFSLRWWLSVGAMTGAFFAMASGAFIGLASFVILVMQILVGARRQARDYAAACLLLLMFIILMTYVPSVPGHDGLKAHSLTDLVKALLLCLDYPRKNPLVGLWINLPLVVYSCFVLYTRPHRGSPHWIILSLIVWWFGQIVSLSYGRAIAPTSPRYLDIIIVALLLNFGILLFAQQEWGAIRQRFILPVLGLWLVITVTGLVFNALSSSFPSVVQRRLESVEQQNNVTAYLRTGDISTLQGKPLMSVPYPIPQRLALLLSDPTVRLLLPQPIRPADIDPQKLLDITLFKGWLRPLVVGLKTTVIHLAPMLISVGFAFFFLAGLIGRLGESKPDAEII